jgi:uncharacterized protein (DUF1697 family)
MNRFVAFIRGINVGGHIVTKDQLIDAFISLGFQNVSTFGQSGNIIFETNDLVPEEIKAKIENKLCTILSYQVALFIKTISQLKSVIDFDPFKNHEAEGASYLVTFLSSPPAKLALQLPLIIPKSTAQILAIRGSEVFSVTHGGGEGALPNQFLESKLQIKATTRNINVIKRIVEKCNLLE